MFKPHYLSSEEKIDDELMGVSNAIVPIKRNVTESTTRSGEIVGYANQWKHKVKVFAVKIMSVRGRALRGDVV